MPRPRSQPFSEHLTPEAEQMLALVQNRHDRHHLTGFLGHLCLRGVPLAAATAADIEAFAASLAGLGVDRPQQAGRDAAISWNRQAGQPGWPAAITLKAGPKSRILDFGALAPALQADIMAFLERTAGDGIFDERGARPLAAQTIRDRRGKICQLVAILIDGGQAPAIQSLAELTAEAAVRHILGHVWERGGKAANGHGANLARTLKLIAQHHTGAPLDVIDLIKSAEGRLRPAKTGMTDRNKARLRQIIEPQRLKRLIDLPQRFVAGLDQKRPSITDALCVQSVLALMILLNAPMREKNLAELDLERHLDLVGDEQCHIVIPLQSVKNQVTLNYVLGPSFIALLKLYHEVYRPLLLKHRTSTAIFVSRNGRQKDPAQLGAQIQKFIRKQADIVMNVHLFRHLAGYLFLKAHPGEYEPVRQLLGHKSIQTTISFYVGLEEADAFRRYDLILDGYRQGEDHAPA